MARIDYPTDVCRFCKHWKDKKCTEGREESASVIIFGYCGFFAFKSAKAEARLKASL